MTQHEEESIEAFETRLTTQAKKCKFTVPSVEIPAVPAIEDQPAIPTIPIRYKNISEEMIRDRIVVGIQNKSIQRRLLREKDLTLRSAVDMLKVIETANQQAKTYLSLNQTPTGIDTLQKNRRKLRTQSIPTQKPRIRCYKQLNNPKTKLDECGRCGGPQHSRSQCPAMKAVCYQCKIVGHFSKKCRTKKIHELERKHDNSPTASYNYSFDTDMFMGLLVSHMC